jgi:hypothetical protein
MGVGVDESGEQGLAGESAGNGSLDRSNPSDSSITGDFNPDARLELFASPGEIRFD